MAKKTQIYTKQKQVTDYISLRPTYLPRCKMETLVTCLNTRVEDSYI